MAYDSGLADRTRDALRRLGERGIREKNVFGGWGFIAGKSAFVIVWEDGLIVKAPPDEYPAALGTTGVTPFAPNGERPMSTWVVVADDVVADDPELADWVARGLRGVRATPAKRAKPAKRATRAKPAKRAKRATKQRVQQKRNRTKA